MSRVGLFESEVVRALEAFGDFVKVVFILEDIAVGDCTDISTGGRHLMIWIIVGRGSYGDLPVGRYASGGAIDPTTM